MKRSMENCQWIVLIFTLFLIGVEPSKLFKNVQRIVTRENNFPVFKECSSYTPRVKEEQPAETPVITVVATDPDPPGEGGTITYQLISDSSEQRFSINSSTGQIVTNVKFNRDEPARQQVERLIVRAKDDGRQQLEDFCLLTITIEDVNDNAPMFEKSNYAEVIPMDMEVNSEVVRISATDIDDGLNREVEYTLGGTGGDYDFFTIDKISGSVKLMKMITQPVDYVFKLQVSAKDMNPTEPKSATVQLEIKIIEANRQHPKFGNPLPKPVIEILENFNNANENIATFKVDFDIQEQPPVFTLLTGRSEETNSKDTFVLITNGEENTAFIRWSGNGRLDHEVLKEYSLKVRIENEYKLATEHPFKVKLIDVNDNAPKFEKKDNSRQVRENEPPGTVVMKVQATDADSTPAFKQITYVLQDFTDVFELDSKSGVMITKKPLDREVKDVYTIKVIAEDGAPSAILNNGKPNTDELVFRIDVIDQNDNSPRFAMDMFTVEIPENAEVNTFVIELKATDPDSGARITYSIVSGNEDDKFMIDSATGVIKTKGKLDFETKARYLLKVKADDGQLNSDCTVHIKVLDINENTNKFPPKFVWKCQEVSIEEKKLIPGCIATVKALDPDLKPNEDQKIVYSLLNASLAEFFKIDAKSGCLSLVKPLLRFPEKPSTRTYHWKKHKWCKPEKRWKWSKQYKVLIKSSDECGNPMTSKSSVAVVFVNVTHKCWLAKRKRCHIACKKFKPCADGTFDCLLNENNKITGRSRRRQ